jgi:IS5 family transposase
VYSNIAIEMLLTIRELFKLPYRATEGFSKGLVSLMQINLQIPDYSALCKRASKLDVHLDLPKKSGKIDVIVDSTGLKVYGEGEWKMKMHGKAKRRTWRKLHLMIDADSQCIVAETLTKNDVHDTNPVPSMLDSLDNAVNKFYGDGIFDTAKMYKEADKRDIVTIIPPKKNARLHRHGNSHLPKLQRDEAIRGIRKLGREVWKESIGYHRRSLVETTMYRMKQIFGGKLKNRHLRKQQTEAALRCKILNKFTSLGMPIYDDNS